MRRIFLALGAVALGGAILASGPALAGSKWGKYGKGKYGYGNSVSTGQTFCEAGDAAVFPATNVGKRAVRVKVECVDQGQDGDFDFLDGFGLEDGKIPAGGTAILAKESCESVVFGGELVRCTVKARGKSLSQIRGVLHICDDVAGELEGCALTEALSFGSGSSGRDDDDDDD